MRVHGHTKIGIQKSRWRDIGCETRAYSFAISKILRTLSPRSSGSRSFADSESAGRFASVKNARGSFSASKRRTLLKFKVEPFLSI